MAQFDRRTGSRVLLCTAVLFTSVAVQAATSVVLSADIAYEGACDISVPATITFNNGEPIYPSVIEADFALTKQNFTMTLTDCKGMGVIPKIVVTGTSTTAYGEDMFVDSTSSAKGYGIYLSTVGNTYFKSNPNLATIKRISVIDDWSLALNFIVLNGSLPLVAQLTCGNCSFSGRSGGDLNASITFDFQYE